MSHKKHPYRDFPNRAFWKRAISERHFLEVDAVSEPIEISMDDQVATAGSCFAQHLGHHLRQTGIKYLDLEPKPNFIPDEQEKRYGYGIYSCRYGNIYFARQLRQLFEEAMGQRSPVDSIWQKQGRYFDALRPAVDPVGLPSASTVAKARQAHLKHVRKMFETLDVFIFTLGMTEAWVSKKDGTVYPTVPGSIAGDYSIDNYAFHNFRYPEIFEDLCLFWQSLKAINPTARMVLTVSPNQMIATASGRHILSANMRSKSLLRVVAEDLAEDCEEIFYFPSYDLVASHPARGLFFNPDLRTLNRSGVEFVVKHFLQAVGAGGRVSVSFLDDVVCDDEIAHKWIGQ